MLLQGTVLDSLLTGWRGSRVIERSLSSEMRLVNTRSGTIRVLDTGGLKQPIVIVPDGPCVIEHYATLVRLLIPTFRVVCFDLPGFGFSYPAWHYTFSVAQTAETIVELMDTLNIRRAVLAFTCANSFFALHVAKNYAERVSHLVLGQTPSFQAVRDWDSRVIPKVLHVPYFGQLAVAGLARIFSSRWYKVALPTGSEHKDAFTSIADQALRVGGCFCLASFVQGLNKTQENQLNDIQTPTLLTYGDADRSHRRTDFASLRTHVPAAQIHVFQGCGHFPDLERPEVYAAQVQHFVSMA